ncbi:hypothetical protein [Chromobacterium sphagni]|uniref:Uncharacterized protein n=1 Tax=Chromobacterium sphagni TaxID=1903179 RepID=A0ABX3C771_9NEIS|nr:hypothetical protein [Chromobacterium sphagni]OHX16160.1 hypothetical protein BI344_21745 [Chromobacterium sphagni]
MSLIVHCAYQNPINGGILPAVPQVAQSPRLAPAQGDHVFGDVVGVVGNALTEIFGGGVNWQNRMRAYNANLAAQWTGLTQVDLGHTGAHPPVVARQGAPEVDRHAHMFGGYGNRLQWYWCEVVCAGFQGGIEDRRVGGKTQAWKNQVMGAFDEVINNLVDETALRAYIANPGQTRQADPNSVLHTPVSLARATAIANGLNGPGKARIQQILGNTNPCATPSWACWTVSRQW